MDDGMGEGISFVDGDCVADTITGVEHDTGGTSGGVQGEDSLDGDVHGGRVESLEHDLRHLLTIGFGVERSFCEEDGMFFWSNTKLVVEGVMPDLFHIIPVGDNSVLDGVFQCEDTPLTLCFIANVRIFLAHTNHHTLMTRTTHDRGEDGSWSIIPSETSLAHSRSIVDDEGSNIIISHFDSREFATKLAGSWFTSEACRFFYVVPC